MQTAVKLIPMEMRSSRRGQALCLSYCFIPSAFGEMLLASAPEGICSLSFVDSRIHALDELRERFPQAAITEATETSRYIHIVRGALSGEKLAEPIELYISSTPFRLRVWKALAEIPFGATATYGEIARAIGLPSASRAVGQAIGANPVALLIPCHRVICADGSTGHYRWGDSRKQHLLAHEAKITRAQ